MGFAREPSGPGEHSSPGPPRHATNEIASAREDALAIEAHGLNGKENCASKDVN